jgi:peptidoglycan hydrolase-like protein with peptidoglycan-binding domain
VTGRNDPDNRTADFCPIGQRAMSARSDVDAGDAMANGSAVDLARLTASGIPRVAPHRPFAAAASVRTLAPAGDRQAAPAPNAPITSFDAGSRERWAFGVQRAAGNRTTRALAEAAIQREGEGASTGKPSAWDLGPNPYATETPGGGSKRTLDANPYADENDPVTLSNPRFTAVPRLAKIASGGGVLSAADNGPAVKAVQQALIDLGFEMVRHGRDGSFGSETREAIGLFRQRRGMPGDQLSAKALGELDSSAPPPGAQEQHYFDFERLFEDGYLDVTMAVGYSEDNAHVRAIKTARDWLAARGFEAAPPEPGQPELFRLRREVTYPTRDGNRVTREIIVRAKLISPGEGAAAQYGDALAESEIATYNGHARRGIGPDFDPDKSAKENFIIGVDSALHAAGRAIATSKIEQNHYVIDHVNDLEQMTKSGRFDKEKYRVWFFGACTSLAYFDELRGGILPESIDRSNLDLLGTRHENPNKASVPETLALLDGILAAQTIEQISAAMEKAGIDAIMSISDPKFIKEKRAELLDFMKDLVVHEGAGDNPVAAAPAAGP